MKKTEKYHQILDALEELLDRKDIKSISVSEIAQKAGMGKGSIYYYFPSKDAILDALVERNYEQPLETAKSLAKQTDISPFTRMAMLFQACRNSSAEFLKHGNSASRDVSSFGTFSVRSRRTYTVLSAADTHIFQRTYRLFF